MPYARETLSKLQQDAYANFATRMPGSAPYQRGTVENVLGLVMAGFQNDQYAQTDWISKEAVPRTANGELKNGWGGVRNILLDGPCATQLNYQILGIPGQPVYSASTVTRGDGTIYTVPVG